MAIYFYLLLVVIVFLSLSKNKKNSLGIIFVFLILTLFSGFRFEVGIDYVSYSYLFDNDFFIKMITREPGFSFLVALLKKFLPNKYYLFLVFAIITQYFILKAIFKLSDNIKISVIIYFCTISFYLFSFNIVRQFVAASIFLYSLHFLLEKDVKKYVISCLLAAFFFHASIIFLLPLCFLYKYPTKKINLLIVIGSAIVIGVNLKVFVSNTIFSNYAVNTTDEELGIGANVIVFMIVAIMIELFRDKNEPIKSTILNNINLFGIGLLIILIFQTDKQLIVVIKRLHNFCLLTYVLLIPYLIENSRFNKKTNMFIKSLLTIFFFLMYSYYVIGLGEHIKIVPYNTYLNL